MLGEASSANNYLSATIFSTFDVLSKLSAIIQLIISNTLNATAPGWDVQSRSLWNHACADLPQLIVPTLAEQLEMRT